MPSYFYYVNYINANAILYLLFLFNNSNDFKKNKLKINRDEA